MFTAIICAACNPVPEGRLRMRRAGSPFTNSQAMVPDPPASIYAFVNSRRIWLSPDILGRVDLGIGAVD